MACGHIRARYASRVAYGINGVPFFVIDGRYGVSGAQELDVFAQALRQTAEDDA